MKAPLLLLPRFTLWLALGCAAVAAPWPAWRGPTGDGVTTETDLPMAWSAASHVKWKAPLPDRGNSTPIVSDGRVFVTQAVSDTHRRTLLCFDRKDGQLLWESGVTFDEAEPTHATNPYCSASPATDGERIVVSFGSAGVFCYDFDGKELWRRADLGPEHHIWGNASSPVLGGDVVFFNFGPGEKTVLYCFDKKTGKTLWQHQEPGGSSGEGGGKNWLGSWADPLLRKVGDGAELFMAYPGRVCAFNPATGEELWTCSGLNPLVYNSLLYEDGVVVAMGGFNGAALAVRAGGQGDVTATHRLWQLPKVSQRIGSGVVYGGYHYIVSDPGVAECRKLQTGELVFQERLKGPGATTQNWSSLVRSGDHLYAINQSGDCFIFQAAPKFALLATNSLGEKVIASVAPSDGDLFIRSYQHLWCIER